MHEPDKKLPKYMLKMPLGANTNTKKHNQCLKHVKNVKTQ